jgi:hypothetical protein
MVNAHAAAASPPVKRLSTDNTGDKVGPRTCQAGYIGANIVLS